MVWPSIWPRAKHLVGPERPHFLAPCRGQSDPGGRSSPNKFAEQSGQQREGGKNFILHLHLHHFLHQEFALQHSSSGTLDNRNLRKSPWKKD